MSHRPPPKKQKGHKTGPRRFNGEVMDVASVTAMLVGEEPKADRGKVIRSRAARGLLPYRKWNGRIIFLRSEILSFLEKLPGVTTEQALANVAARQEPGR